MLAKPFLAIMPSNLCINPMIKCFYCHVRIFHKLNVLRLCFCSPAQTVEKQTPVNLQSPQHSNGESQWHPTPVFLPGKSHGRKSLVGCSP